MSIIPNTQSRTFGQTMALATAKALAAFALVAVAFVLMAQTASTVTASPEAREHGAAAAEQPAVKGSPADLMERHNCWSGEAPADMQGVIPGHVVILMDGDVSAQYRGSKYVGIALAHIFEKPNPNVVEVVGFCR